MEHDLSENRYPLFGIMLHGSSSMESPGDVDVAMGDGSVREGMGAADLDLQMTARHELTRE
jgi:hypothetical protein